MRKGLVGVAVGAAAALGGAWAVRKWLGADEYTAEPDLGADGAAMGAETPAPRQEGLDPVLLEILACPDDKQPVIYQREGDAERLTCTKCGKRYPVRDGIPVMLIDEAQPGPVPSEDEIAAAKALASQGKPAIVGAAGSATMPAGAPAAEAGGAATAAEGSSTERVEQGQSLDPGSGVG